MKPFRPSTVRRSVALLAIGVLCAGIGQARAWGQTEKLELRSLPPDPMDVVRRSLLVGDDVFTVGPPSAICGPPGQFFASVSQSGEYVLVVQFLPLGDIETAFDAEGRPKRAKIELLMWDVVARRGTVVWRGVCTETQISMPGAVQWIPGSATALVPIYSAQISEKGEPIPGATQKRLLLVDAVRATARTVATLDPELPTSMMDVAYVVCTTQPKAAILPVKQDRVQVLRADGTLSRTLPVSVPGAYLIGFIGWREDGKTLYGHALFPAPDVDGKPQVQRVPQTVLLDTETGAVTVQEGHSNRAWRRDPNALRYTVPPLVVTSGDGKLTQSETAQTLKPLWLSGTGPNVSGRILLAADAANPLFLTDGASRQAPIILPGAVLYQSQGTLYAVPIVRVNQSAFAVKKRKALQAETVSRAKQVGLALLGYVLDNDEQFPPPGSGVSAFAQYLKNSDALNNPETGKFALELVYTIKKQAEYPSAKDGVLGYLGGPGGRAVLYADGHVVWEDNKL